MTLNVVDLDFDTIRENLKDYLRTQPEFVDYDFEGSGMAVILNVLAYATHYMGVHANLSINEIFLDSAALRNSVVSKAKELNYFPRQKAGSTAIIKLSITNPSGSPANIIVDKDTKFICSLDGVSYQFVTTDSYTMVDVGGGVYEAEFPITQGIINTQQWIFNTSDPDQHFIISQPDIDTRFLGVDIKDSPTSTNIVTWSRSQHITTVDGDSEVFFLQEVSDNKIEIYFGDGILGKALENNNVIITEYLTTYGAIANGCSIFELVNDIGIYAKNLFTVTLVEKSSGGADEESIASIKHIAPKAYQAQNRAVIANDYKALLISEYGDIETISVWGGEDNIPPQFGRVYISIKPLSGTELSPASKVYIEDEILANYNIVGIIPELIDPEYTYIDITSSVLYDRDKTTQSAGQIENDINAAIEDHFISELTKFDSVFRYSKFLTVIDNAEAAILSNLTSIKLTKKFRPSTGEQTYRWDFGTEIDPGSVISEVYSYGGGDYQLKDDGAGNLDEYKNDLLLESGVGVITYATGIVELPSHDFGVPSTTEIDITITPAQNDIYTLRNNLILLGNVNLTVAFVGET